MERKGGVEKEVGEMASLYCTVYFNALYCTVLASPAGTPASAWPAATPPAPRGNRASAGNTEDTCSYV